MGPSGWIDWMNIYQFGSYCLSKKHRPIHSILNSTHESTQFYSNDAQWINQWTILIYGNMASFLFIDNLKRKRMLRAYKYSVSCYPRIMMRREYMPKHMVRAIVSESHFDGFCISFLGKILFGDSFSVQGDPARHFARNHLVCQTYTCEIYVYVLIIAYSSHEFII